jgi:hypothetical protein
MTTIESLEQRHHVLTVKHSQEHPIKMTSIVCLLDQYLLTHLHHHWLHQAIKNKCHPIPWMEQLTRLTAATSTPC